MRFSDRMLSHVQPKRLGWALIGLAACLFQASAVQAQTALRTIAQVGTPVKFGPSASARPGLCREVAHRLELLDPGLQFSGLGRDAPLRRIELLLERGEIDVFFCLLDTPERRQRFDYLPVPIYRVRHVVAVRVDETRQPANHQQLAELGRRSPVLVTQGSVLARTLAKAGVPYLEAAPTDLAALRMLAQGRADAVYGQDLNLQPLLKSPELAGKIKLLEASFVDEFHYVVVSRHLKKAAVDRVLAALNQLDRQGLLRELQDKYQQP